MTYIIRPKQIQKTNQLGGKAGALAALGDIDLNIPAWIGLSPTAFYDSLNETERHALETTTDSTQILTLPDNLTPSPAVEDELRQALANLCPNGELVAVRSSAPDEDGRQHSFAGQLDSFLFVKPQEVASKIVAVWLSAFSQRSLTYRREQGLSPTPQAPAVLIQRMVKAGVSGVAFSVDPVSGRRDLAVIGALYGLGTALVSGQADADTYHVDRQGQITGRNLAMKRIAHIYRNKSSEQPKEVQSKTGLSPVSRDPIDSATLETVTLPDSQACRPALSDAQIRLVADLARRTEEFFGRPQDIEWAIEDEQLYLLQSRPITGLPDEVQISEMGPTSSPETFETSDLAQANDVLNVWDNSNIAESYPGVTTPLTFSFARRAYEEVYRQFCRMMGVPAHRIARHNTTFRRMLGLMQGRIYYNLLSWYQVLALLPGYKLNRRFMEQMMGVKESLPDELLDQHPASTRASRFIDGLSLLRTIFGLMANYLLLPGRIDRFYLRLNQALGTGRPDLSRFRADELVAYYRKLEQQLLTRWDAPLVNDFFAMIFYGLLRKLTERWCADNHGTLQNELLAGSGGIISAEPVIWMQHMAQLAAADPTFITTLGQGSVPEISAYMPGLPKFEAKYQAYLDKFGDRCLEELKLESATLYDDPLILLRSVGQLARQLSSNGPQSLNVYPPNPPEGGIPVKNSPLWGVGGDFRGQRARSSRAERRVNRALKRHPLRRIIFNWILKNARALLRNRENLRFERTRLFGRARMIFIELGRKFHALNLLADPRDIFYLEVEEVLGFVNGTTVTTDLNGLVAVRKAEFERYRAMEPPPGRFETRGIPYQSFEFQSSNSGFQRDTHNGKSRQGLGCSPGLIRGQVRVVTDPKTTRLQPGEILVAERTDPGWIMLFPIAAGLLVEHGSLLSHSAIVSREMGLPAVVALPGVTRWLKDGDWVEFDGSTGLVTRLELPV